MSASSSGTSFWIRMWFGASSRVAFPVAKTLESLSNVYLPSGFGYDLSRSPMKMSTVASSWVWNWVPGGKRPPEISIMFASAPPTRNPFENTWRMLRERCISAAITDPSIACW